jgi:hypothetical protein
MAKLERNNISSEKVLPYSLPIISQIKASSKNSLKEVSTDIVGQGDV